MLQVIGSTGATTCYVETDGYVPLNLRCAHPPGVHIHWRTGSLDTSLLEIALDPDNGAICEVTLTFIDPETVVEADTTVSVMTRAYGMPICNISQWPSGHRLSYDPDASRDRHRDDPGAFSVKVGEDSIAVWLGPETALNTLYQTDAAQFGADEAGHLRYLRFERLSRHNIDLFMSAVKWMAGRFGGA